MRAEFVWPSMGGMVVFIPIDNELPHLQPLAIDGFGRELATALQSGSFFAVAVRLFGWRVAVAHTCEVVSPRIAVVVGV